MSDRVPKLSFGHRVRVMQTDEMVRQGLANSQGVVVDFYPSESAWVRLDGDLEATLLSASCLERLKQGG